MNEYTKVNWQDGTVLQPAKVTIDGVDHEVTPAVESGTTPVNATNLDKMDTALKQAHDGVRSLDANKINKSTIELLTVDSTAPENCNEGDLYYNTTTNLLYAATGTDTWSETGELPTSKYLYVDLSNSKLYYYDGNNFTSYGGGSSNDVVISPDQPTGDDWKLWIDSDEVINSGSEVVNSLEGNETNLAPSVRAVNNLFSLETMTTDFGTLYFQKNNITKFISCFGVLTNLSGTYKSYGFPSSKYVPLDTFNYYAKNGTSNNDVMFEFNINGTFTILGILPSISSLSGYCTVNVVYKGK